MRFKSNAKLQPELVAAKDPSRPVLGKVHLNVEESEVWVTDSYCAARFPVDLDENDTSGPIPVDAMKAARKPPNKYGPAADIIVNGNARVSQDGVDYLTVPRDESSYQFPNLTELFPDNWAGFEIALDAERLYKMARAMGANKGASKIVRLRFVSDNEGNPSPLRPISVRPNRAVGEGDPSAILMPVRIAG